jgi:spore germination cell wall hydrolase CwlJ-like protein
MTELRTVSLDQFLRKEAKNASELVDLDDGFGPLQVFQGEKVDAGAQPSAIEMVDGKPVTWTFVEAKEGVSVDKRKGFITDAALDAGGANIPASGGFQRFPLGKVDKLSFADACYVLAELFKTNPAYLYALAFAQSGSEWSDNEVKAADVENAEAFGVYKFPKPTWAALLQLNETAGLSDALITAPTAQCLVAAVLAAKAADLLKGLVTDHGLSAVDLYLAHLFADDKSFGSNAAARMLEAENKDSGQKCALVVEQTYQDAAVRAAFFKRNKAIFKEDGSATVAEALKIMSDALQAGFDQVKKLAHDIQKTVPADPDSPIFGGSFTGKIIALTNEDVDALARVSDSEVGNFGMFGDDVLADALAAVVDTVFNRAIYPTKEFPKTVQGVIDQEKQFSAINNLGTWKKLPKAPTKNFDLVSDHVRGRAHGKDSKIKGATHFFNPDTSNPDWGEAIRHNPLASYGKPKNSHLHGLPDGYHPPESYAVQFGSDVCAYTGDGKSLGRPASADKTVASIIAAAMKEWTFWGESVPKKIAHSDNEISFATYVRDTYCKPLNADPSLQSISDDKYPWSAVCLSYILRQAGLTAAEFTFAQAHSVYIREAIKARAAGDKSKAYWGYRISEAEAVLAPGDLVGAGREKGMTFAQAQLLFDRKDDYDSHCDVVVAVEGGTAKLVGGNVSDSVTMKAIALDATGKIAEKENLSFVVLKRNKPA